MNTTKQVPIPDGKQVMRVRFRVSYLKPDGSHNTDYRPIKWPSKHPYWCIHSDEASNLIVAYVETTDEVFSYWPDATDLEILEEGLTEYTFTMEYNQPYWLIL